MAKERNSTTLTRLKFFIITKLLFAQISCPPHSTGFYNAPLDYRTFDFSQRFSSLTSSPSTLLSVCKVRIDCLNHVRTLLCDLTHFSIRCSTAYVRMAMVGCPSNEKHFWVFFYVPFVERHFSFWAWTSCRSKKPYKNDAMRNMSSHVLQCVWMNFFSETSLTSSYLNENLFPSKDNCTINETTLAIDDGENSFNWLRDWMSSVAVCVRTTKEENDLRSPEPIERQKKLKERKTEFFSLHRAEMLCAAWRLRLTVRYRWCHIQWHSLNGGELLSI